jgi:hypothetical protein
MHRVPALMALPRVPRLPLVPDPFRRIHVPRDLKAITVTGEQKNPAGGDLSERTANRIWAAGRELYRTGVHPALQLCVRRNG